MTNINLNRYNKIEEDNMVFTLLSIGANLGEKKENIENAVNHLIISHSLYSVLISSFYETEPVGYTEQPWFINVAVCGYTNLSIFNFLQFCKSIEYSMGRELNEKWHERLIDIDILLYDNDFFNYEKIIIPHPRMHERKFVLAPASEIAPNAIHPQFGLTIEQLLINCPDKSIVKKCS